MGSQQVFHQHLLHSSTSLRYLAFLHSWSSSIWSSQGTVSPNKTPFLEHSDVMTKSRLSVILAMCSRSFSCFSRCCALLGVDVCSVGFWCRWCQLLPPAPGATYTPPLPKFSGSNSRCAPRNLFSGIVGMLKCWLDHRNADWIGLGGHHILTGAEK